jgi:hypothetical protein
MLFAVFLIIVALILVAANHFLDPMWAYFFNTSFLHPYNKIVFAIYDFICVAVAPGGVYDVFSNGACFWLCEQFWPDAFFVSSDLIGFSGNEIAAAIDFAFLVANLFLSELFTGSVGYESLDPFFDLQINYFNYKSLNSPHNWEYFHLYLIEVFILVIETLYTWISTASLKSFEAILWISELIAPVDYLVWQDSYVQAGLSAIRSLTQFFVVKFLVVIAFVVIIRSGTPRYRFDYLTKLGWLKFLGFTLCIFIALIIYFFFW